MKIGFFSLFLKRSVLVLARALPLSIAFMLASLGVQRQATASPTCRDAFLSAFVSHQGTRADIQTHARLGLAEDETAYFLGEGVLGGKVYRVVSPREEYVLKSYKRMADKKRDLSALRVLRSTLQTMRSKNPHLPHLRVVDAEDAGGAELKLSSVHGVSLEHLVSPQSHLSDDLKERLIKRYTMLFDELATHLASENRLEGARNFSLTVITQNGRMREKMFLHFGNVVVDPVTFEMTIIDPF